MFLRKILFFSFLILYEISTLVNTQEYLKELKPKDIKYINPEDLLPVELPRPIKLQRQARSSNEEIEILKDETILENERLQKSKRPTLMDIALEASVQQGLSAMRKLYLEMEPDIIKNGRVLPNNHPGVYLSKFNAPVEETTKRDMAAYAILTAAKVFRKNYNLNNDLARQANNQKVSLRRTALESLCPPRVPPTCMPASERYRTHDGTCNNKRRLRWGAAQMPFNRFLPPKYDDDVDSPRTAVNGGTLSSSRFVSLLVHGARDGDAPFTLMLAQWGQLLDHDLTSTAQPRSINGSVPSCCGNKDFHPSCFPIKVPLDDPWLSPLEIRCLEFLRSAPAQRRDCVLSWREQTNQVTSYIDASPIYSSSVKFSDNARVFRKGLLIFGRGNPADDVCQRGAIATHCIRSGDGRSSEQPGLLALHHVWVNEHNHIASKLGEMNLHWSDEKIYQETRRIIGAMFQHITYREFLPIVLGREVMKLFDLELLQSGYYEGYDGKINPTVANAFSTAAFRFGHSLIQNFYVRCDRFHNIIDNNVSLHEEFQKGDIGSVGSLHRLLRGMATQRALERDEFITPELTNHLFQTPGFPFGLDLAAINIQRGRDHGIPPYTHWRVPCGLSPINTWQEFANAVGPESAKRISHAYQSVHDIDLFVGGIAERPVAGGLVGSTFACIIAQQFSNSRKGDRFWYENAGFESSFTPAQLHAIRRVSFASVLCRAVGGGTFQPHIFLPPQFPNNKRLPCGVASLGDFDISPWLEEDPFASLTSVESTSSSSPSPTIPDRIFDIVQLETKSPVNKDIRINNTKVGFSNRNPDITVTKDKPILTVWKPHIEFVPNVATATKISDKLDLKRKDIQGHIIKQKPVPGVNSKLDKNNRKTGNRHNIIQNTTRKTIIVNNIPIELKNVDTNKPKLKTGETKFDNKNESKLEPRIADLKLLKDEEKTNDKLKKENKVKFESRVANINNDIENSTKVVTLEVVKEQKGNFSNISTKKLENEQLASNEQPDSIIEKKPINEINNSLTFERSKISQPLPSVNKKGTLDNTKKIDIEQLTSKIIMSEKNLLFQTDKQSDVVLKTINATKNLQNFELKNVTSPTTDIKVYFNDSDIDPIAQATPLEHKRVQRKHLITTTTEQLKTKLKLTTNYRLMKRNNTASQINASTPAVELRQYQNRPSFTKPSQNVKVDSVNEDNQFEIEINIWQTQKNPKPLQSTSYITDYTNGYKPNYFNRYTTKYSSYASTTPLYGYYQPAPTQIPLLPQTRRTKPPTIILVNEHDERTTSKQPGFLHSIEGWKLGTKRPLTESIGFNERPGHETIVGSPHSTAQQVATGYQNLISHTSQLTVPARISSFSQAQLGYGTIQASSTSISNGNFGTIAGFSSANGADSIFSFNIRPKPDKTQQNGKPTDSTGSYTLVLPQRNPWYPQNPEYAGGEFPYKENVNSPFSTSNSQTYYIHNKNEPQRKEGLTFKPSQEFLDYDYIGRTLKPLRNVTISEGEDTGIDYEYDDDYETSLLLRKYNQDGYLRPEHMIGTELKTGDDQLNIDSLNVTIPEASNQTLDNNYLMALLNESKILLVDLPINLTNRLNANVSRDFPDALAKHLNNNIFAKNDDVNNTMIQNKTNDLHKRKKNSEFNHEKIAFALINVLTKPERPDNWVFFESPEEKPLLPQMPEINTDKYPSAEIPKPFKENIWLDLTKVKRKYTLQFQGPIGQQFKSVNSQNIRQDVNGEIDRQNIQMTELNKEQKLTMD